MKVSFIFAEGAHDVAFIRQVMEEKLGLPQGKNINTSEFGTLPEPLPAIFDKEQKTSPSPKGKNASTDVSEKKNDNCAFAPSCVFDGRNTEGKGKDDFIMLFSMNGKKHDEQLKSFVEKTYRIIMLLHDKMKDASMGSTFDTSAMRWVFIYDADDQNAHDALESHKAVLLSASNDGKPVPIEGYAHFYAWPNNNDNGTLEDVLIDVYSKRNKGTIDAAESFLDAQFKDRYDVTDDMPPEHASALATRKKKAIITIAGQGFDKRFSPWDNKPFTEGKALQEVIQGRGLALEEDFAQDPRVTAFADFIAPIVL